MDYQSQQRYCTNCGQPLAPGAGFCNACGMPVSSLQPDMGSQLPPQAFMPPSPNPFSFPGASQVMQPPPQPAIRRRSKLRGCGCLVLLLAALAGPFIGAALTSGKLHLIFIYAAGGIVVLFLLLLLIAMLLTRGGREALGEMAAEGCTEGCLDALFGGLLGGK
ncbi:MAG TPA: zinc ribbon domain-containing protein [Ktedonobacteraceae bacterium]|nr:zinc ribbon domain-containing protein [Ktedonobacteraceae bacterium]